MICSQNKQEAYLEPVEPEGSAYEDIKKDHWIHLIHGVGIGRMVVQFGQTPAVPSRNEMGEKEK